MEGYELKEAGLVMLGGASGALTRYMLQQLALRIGLTGQIGLLTVNVSGSFALGLLLSFWLTRTSYPTGCSSFSPWDSSAAIRRSPR